MFKTNIYINLLETKKQTLFFKLLYNNIDESYNLIKLIYY